MPRRARVNIGTSYIHLIVQGINQEYIFRRKEWKENFISILENKIKNTNIEILSYCIMDNHAHFLIYCQVPEELSDLMRKVNTTYAMRYNKLNKRKGFVFRDRFFTQPILSQKQLYNCLVYIHRNPVSAGICLKMEDYCYSSYNEYINGRKVISSNSIKLIFKNEAGYIEQFYAIHKELQEIENIKDVIEYEDNVEMIIREYENKIEGSFEENEFEFGKLLVEIRQSCGVSLRDMSEIFKVNKDKLNKYIHKFIENGE
ncbi:MAG: hypothetical protein HFJ51_06825 [Clostridia bacterium]|nr:hypothetical protein [Clostridia bacterium]